MAPFADCAPEMALFDPRNGVKEVKWVGKSCPKLCSPSKKYTCILCHCSYICPILRGLPLTHSCPNVLLGPVHATKCLRLCLPNLKFSPHSCNLSSIFSNMGNQGMNQVFTSFNWFLMGGSCVCVCLKTSF